MPRVLTNYEQATDRPGFQYLDAGTVRTTYDMLLYGLLDCDAEPPLSPGSPVRVGPYRFRVLKDEPDTATVLLIRERGLMLGYWLRRAVLRAAEVLGRWANNDEQPDLEQIRERARELNARYFTEDSD